MSYASETHMPYLNMRMKNTVILYIDNSIYTGTTVCSFTFSIVTNNNNCMYNKKYE